MKLTLGAKCQYGGVAEGDQTGQCLTRRRALLSGVSAAPLMSVGRYSNAWSPEMKIPKVPLNENVSISRVIKGCWQLSGGHRGDSSTDRTYGADAVYDFKKFVDGGITTFDTADIYGPSQELIGQFIEKFPEEGKNCQVLTKFCCFGTAMRQAADGGFVKRSIDANRVALRMKQLDCVQFYWNDFSIKNYQTAALHLLDLQSSEVIKAIGVTNFDTRTLAELVDDAGCPIVSNQIQYSLLDTRPENGMIDYCSSRGIWILPYGTVAGGFLTDRYLGARPQDVKINTYSLSKYASILNQRGGWKWYQELLETMKAIGDRYGVSIADVASRWVLQRPRVAGVIIGARNANHISDHTRLFSFSLDQTDESMLQEVLQKGKKPQSDCYIWERGGSW